MGRIDGHHVGIRTRVPVPGKIPARQRREGKTGLRSNDAIPLPAANHFIREPAGSVGPTLAPSKWQLISEIAAELMRDVEAGWTLAEVQTIRIHGGYGLVYT